MGYPQKNEFKTVVAALPTGFHWGEACSAETQSSEVIPDWVTITPSRDKKSYGFREASNPYGSRPAPHNLLEKAEDRSRIKLESQASHA